MFTQIWMERPHYCQHCAKPLGPAMHSYYFSHIKSKGAHPELRLDPDNIQLLCLPCHNKYDNGV